MGSALGGITDALGLSNIKGQEKAAKRAKREAEELAKSQKHAARTDDAKVEADDIEMGGEDRRKRRKRGSRQLQIPADGGGGSSASTPSAGLVI